MTVYTIGILEPFFSLNNRKIDEQEIWDVVITESTSGTAAHPSAMASVPDGYVCVGGGANDQWDGYGNLLTGTFPSDDGRSWTASGKDHVVSSPASITAYRDRPEVHAPNDQTDGRREQEHERQGVASERRCRTVCWADPRRGRSTKSLVSLGPDADWHFAERRLDLACTVEGSSEGRPRPGHCFRYRA